MWMSACAFASATASAARNLKKSPSVSPRPPISPTYKNSRLETRRKWDGSSYQVIGFSSDITDWTFLTYDFEVYSTRQPHKLHFIWGSWNSRKFRTLTI